MKQERTCTNCHAPLPTDAPAGVCPACALRVGLAEASDPLPSELDSLAAAAPTLTAPSHLSAPRSAEEVAALLPELEDFALIGSGGMGAVYRARHRRLNRPVAVKVLASSLQSDAAFGERFIREARTLAQLDHPNIVRVYDFGHRDGTYYLVMELVDGVNLRQTLRSCSLGPAEAMAMVPKICDALQYAHDQGVVHRDIKPENILVDRAGKVKIADFGLAKLVGKQARENLTQSRQIMGTPNYMAPEQVERPETVDHRVDIFALGVVFYELLTGELPIGRFPPPSRKVEVDVRLDEVVLRTLEKEPSLRYQQARELRSDVESLASAPPSDRVITPPPPLPPVPVAEGQPRGYEYRSPRTALGLPWIHIAFSRDPSGTRMRVANGIIAIGDIAIGGVAIGGFAFGGIAFGGIGLGLVSFGGIALGLLAALAGLAMGALPTGGVAIGIIPSGMIEIGLWAPEGAVLRSLPVFGWIFLGLALLLGAGAAIFAWFEAVARGPGSSGARH